MFALLAFSVASRAQNQKIDSLVSVLQKTKNDIDKAQLLNAVADEYKATDPKLMQKYATEALQLATKIKDNVAQGNAFLNLGNAAIILGNYPQALQYFSAAQTVFEKALENSGTENKKELNNGLARAYGSLGVVFSEQSNYAKALQYHLKAVKIYEADANLAKCARVYNNIGVVYKSQGEDFKALNYFIKCLKIQEKMGDNSVGITTTNVGNIYLKQKNYSKAFDYYTKAQQLFVKFPNQRGLGNYTITWGCIIKK